MLFTDRVSNDEGSGDFLKLIIPSKQEFTYVIRLGFKSTNNDAEYEAILTGLRIANKFGARHIEAQVDLMLIACHVNETYEEKDEVMASYLEQAKQLMHEFASCKVIHTKWSEKKSTDALSKLAATSFEHLARKCGWKLYQNYQFRQDKYAS